MSFQMSIQLRTAMMGIVLALLSAGCGSEGTSHRNLGELAPFYSADEIIEAANSACGSGCDGDFGAETSKGASETDFDAALDAFVIELPVFEPGMVILLNEVQNALAQDIPDNGVAGVAYTFTMTLNCNGTGIGMGELGDPEDGTIDYTVNYTAILNELGQVPEGSTAYSRTDIAFSQCVLTGDFLNNAGTQALEIDGSLQVESTLATSVTSATPQMKSVRGTLEIASDLDNDQIFGNEFWGEILDVDAETYDAGSDTPYNGESSYANGGVCIGAMLQLGNNPFNDDDDGCEMDADALPEGFAGASYCGIVGYCPGPAAQD